MLFFVVGFVLLQLASGAIERLSDDEIFQLPDLIKLDRYYPCLRRPGDTYCFVTAKLIGNASNDVYRTLEDYSAYNLIHYNRTLVHWGICANHSCGEYLGQSTLTDSLEACLNSTFERDYQLNTRIIKSECTEYKEGVTFDTSDYAFVAVTLILVLLNLLGSAYDFVSTKERSDFVAKFCRCFAIKENWKGLFAEQGTTIKMKRLKCLSGFRTINTFVMVLGHSPMVGFFTANNPINLERAYHHLIFHFFYNGSLVVQTFFIISGLLLMFAELVSNERNPTTWRSLPKGIMKRWLRLTPPYAFVMFFVMTVGRHVADGPLWKQLVESEAIDCRRDWWLHLLYIHNYVDHNQCMIHAWYLAADFQLTVLGLVITCVLRSARAQKIGIGVMFVVGLITPAAHVFFQNLHAILILSPEMFLNFVVNDATFNNLYKRGHTNLSCYALGLALAYYIYSLKDSDIGSQKFKKCRLLYWLLFPIQMLIILTGATFYIAGIQVPVGVRMIYASAIKILFGSAMCFHILFTILKVDKVCRALLNWGGWSILAKVTYCTYVLHVCVLRMSAANNDMLVRMTVYGAVLNYIAMVGTSFLLALPLYLFVEAPLNNFVKTFVFPSPPQKVEKTKSVTMVADIMISKETIEAKL